MKILKILKKNPYKFNRDIHARDVMTYNILAAALENLERVTEASATEATREVTSGLWLSNSSSGSGGSSSHIQSQSSVLLSQTR